MEIPTAINLSFPTLEFYRLYEPLFNPKVKKRYKIYYGGRGGSKSTMFAQALLLKAYRQKLRILCTREIQRSIRQSVHKLLAKQIEYLNLSWFYKVHDNNIIGANGSEFIFEGLYRNIDSIKSMEGVNIVWIEEGHAISENSWNTLYPTIREKDSEIWISFNPCDEDDFMYQLFVAQKHENAIVVNINYKDNPYFSEPLKSEMENDKKHNHTKYLHVWEGEPVADYESCVYRFNKDVNLVDHDMIYTKGIETIASWDFGVHPSDTAVIIYQIIPRRDEESYYQGYQINIIDEYVNNNQDAYHYRDVVNSMGYKIDRHYCDPAGKARDSSLSSWLDKLAFNKELGVEDWHFEYTSSYGVADMIDHANEVLPFVRMNRYQTPHAYNAIRKWMYRTDKDGKVIKPPKPMHDKYSHPGTSFYYMCINRFPILEDADEVKIY